MRLMLDNFQFQQVYLHSEFEMLKLYLDLQKLRTKNSFGYN